VRTNVTRRGAVVVGAVIALGVVTVACDDDGAASGATAASTGGAAAATTVAGTAAGLTMESYDSITPGMSAPQVAEITGTCLQTNQQEVAGQQAVVYECEGAQPFTGATFVFADGKLVTKAQYGLDGGVVAGTGQMTTVKYDQLQAGQSASEVEAITGPCTKSSETALAGHQSYTLTCYASDGVGSAVLFMSDDKLVSKSQSGLE